MASPIFLWSGASGLALVATASAAIAQETQTAQQPQAATIQEVLVTATKRESSVETIPATIGVIGGAEIAQRGIKDLAGIVELTPGVNLTTPAGNADRITIRGIAGEANTNPTAGILFGDISLQDAYVPHVTLDPYPFDMQDVEVLKGPQGTLFGAQALNGAVRYTPQAPNMSQLGGHWFAQGSFVDGGGNGWGVGAAVNLPLIEDRFAVRIMAYDNALPGWIDNTRTHVSDSNKGEQNGQRIIAEWKPTDSFDAILTFNRQAARFDDIPDTDNLNGQLSASDRPRASPFRDEYDLVSLRLDYDAGPFMAVSETGYVSKSYHSFGENSFSEVPGGAYPLVNTTADEHSESYSQEFRLVSKDSPSSPWSWVAGLYASHQAIEQIDAYQLGDPSLPEAFTAGLLDQVLPSLGELWAADGQPDYTDGHIKVAVKEIAGFASVTRQLDHDFALTVGGRLYDTSSGGTVDNSGLLLDFNSYATTGVPIGSKTLDKSVGDSGFNPSASLSWRPNSATMLYATISKGYRVGGVQWGNSGLLATAPAPSTFRTDSIWNYEVGLRSRLLEDTLQFDATAFLEKWKDPQVLVFVSGGLGAYIDNVGGVTSQGVETALQYHAPVLPGLVLKASATYDDAHTTSSFNTAVGSQLLPKGSVWPLSPRWQTAATVSYDHALGRYTWGAYLTDAYISHAIYGVGQPNVVFGYNQADAQVHLNAPFLPMEPELAFTVTNVASNRGITTSYSGTFWNEVTYIQPRTFTIRLSGNF